MSLDCETTCDSDYDPLKMTRLLGNIVVDKPVKCQSKCKMHISHPRDFPRCNSKKPCNLMNRGPGFRGKLLSGVERSTSLEVF